MAIEASGAHPPLPEDERLGEIIAFPSPRVADTPEITQESQELYFISEIVSEWLHDTEPDDLALRITNDTTLDEDPAHVLMYEIVNHAPIFQMYDEQRAEDPTFNSMVIHVEKLLQTSSSHFRRNAASILEKLYIAVAARKGQTHFVHAVFMKLITPPSSDVISPPAK